MPRRRLDPETIARIMQHEAYRTVARKHPYAVIAGPWIARGVGLAAVVAGLMAAWIYVPHDTLGVAAFLLGIAVALAWGAWRSATGGVQARMMARAKGKDVRTGTGLGWAVGVVVVMLGTLGWLSLWSPYA